MTDLLVHLKIPIPVEEVIGAPALTFASWLPIGDDHAITVEEENICLKLGFDITSTWWATQHKEKDLARMVNVLAHWIFGDAIVRDLPIELGQYMAQRDFTRRPTKEEEPFQQEYDEIAERLLVLLLRPLNRLLSYVRSKKGQYWLSEYPIDSGQMSSYYLHFNAKARIADGPWFRFGPSNISHRTHKWVSEERYIRPDEWDEIRSFVCGVSRPPLVGTLLAGAETLAANGNRRAALTEAITALEIALYAFARSPNADSAFGSILCKRLDNASLLKQVEHLGVTGSVRYLLPVILPESVLPNQVIQDCNRAIEQRHSVVHSGQRDIPTSQVQIALNAIRRICNILESLTVPTNGETDAG